MHYSVADFLHALVLTLAIELPVQVVLSRTFFKKMLSGVSVAKLLIAGVAASGITLPILWFILPRFFTSYATYVATGEIAVLLAEAVFYAFVLRLRPLDALSLSFACNATSYLLGYAVQRMIS